MTKAGLGGEVADHSSYIGGPPTCVCMSVCVCVCVCTVPDKLNLVCHRFKEQVLYICL